MAPRRREGKICARIKSGGVVLSRTRVLQTIRKDRDAKKKIRLAGAPHKKAMAAK